MNVGLHVTDIHLLESIQEHGLLAIPDKRRWNGVSREGVYLWTVWGDAEDWWRSFHSLGALFVVDYTGLATVDDPICAGTAIYVPQNIGPERFIEVHELLDGRWPAHLPGDVASADKYDQIDWPEICARFAS